MFTLEEAMKTQREREREREREQRYSTAFSLTSALNVVGGQSHDPSDLPPGKRTSAHVQEAG